MYSPVASFTGAHPGVCCLLSPLKSAKFQYCRKYQQTLEVSHVITSDIAAASDSKITVDVSRPHIEPARECMVETDIQVNFPPHFRLKLVQKKGENILMSIYIYGTCKYYSIPLIWHSL